MGWVKTLWNSAPVDWLRALVAPWLGAPEVLAPVVVLVVVAFGAGSEIGLPSLLYPEEQWLQWQAGAAVTFLLLEIAFVSFLLEASWFGAWSKRRLLRDGSFGPYAVLVVGLPAVLVGALAPAGKLAFFAGAGLASIVFLGVRRIVAPRLREQLQKPAGMWAAPMKLVRWMGTLAKHPDGDGPGTDEMHGLQLFAVGFVGVVHVTALVVIQTASGSVAPALVLCGLAALVTSNLGAMRCYAGRWYNGVVVGLAVLATLTVCTPPWVNVYDELAAGTPSERPAYRTTSFATPQAAGLVPDEGAFDMWRAHASQHPLANEWSPAKCGLERAPHLLLVAVSGGGIRAAGWAASVLQHLEVDLANGNAVAFPSHIRLVAGASGGMVGAGAWVGSLEENGTHKRELAHVDAFDAVTTDALSSVARALAFAPLVDRGRALEKTWTGRSAGLKRKFSDLREGETMGWRPSLVFTPMSVEDGRRVFVSNLDMSTVTTSTGALLFPDATRYSQNGIQLFQMFPGAQQRLSIATAARMSASFPYVSAAAELPAKSPVRIVDAGYYDNYGVDVLAHWLLENEEDVKHCVAGVAILEIRDSSGHELRNALTADEGGRPKLVASEVLSPPIAILAAREASMSFRNDELLEFLDRIFNGDGRRFFTSVVFEMQESAPLTWALTAEERARLAMDNPDSETAKGYRSARDALVGWLREPKKPYDLVAAPPAAAE